VECLHNILIFNLVNRRELVTKFAEEVKLRDVVNTVKLRIS